MAPVIQTVLTQPTDVLDMKTRHVSESLLARVVFNNFVQYARLHWQYTASARAGGEDVLAGRAWQVPCGGIANALRIVFRGFLDPATQTDFVRKTGYLVTKPRYPCFDGLVTGNVRNAADIARFDGCCLFNEHYFLRYGGRYFDPCMASMYLTEDEVVLEFLDKPTTGLVVSKPTAQRGSVYLYDRTTSAHGFVGSWVRVPYRDGRTVEALRTPLGAVANNIPGETLAKAAEICSQRARV